MTALSSNKKVVVVGAGWSGISAACNLANQSYSVTLYESSKQLGGRARTIQIDNNSHSEVDNGQHLMIGAYQETLKLLKLIAADFNTLLQRQKLLLKMLSNKNDQLILNTYKLPSPFHLFFGLLFCADLTINQKIHVMYFSFKLSSYSLSDDTDISVESLLQRFKQPEKLIKALWEPLCIATLNTPIKIASANIFVTVLKKSLLGNRRDSDFLFTKKNLGAILPEPAVTYLNRHNAEVKLSSRITKIIIKNNCVEGILINDNLIATKNLILAIPPYACAKLLIEHEKLRSLSAKLSQFEYQPICTVYLQYSENISLNQSMVGIWGTTIQWLFDRKLAAQKGLMAAIISADGPHMEVSNELLIKQVQLEIAQLFPDWPAPSYSKVIREKRATFCCSVNISKLRPDNKTTIKGLILCGDYTQTDLPATIEGAVISGKLAASEIIQNNLN